MIRINLLGQPRPRARRRPGPLEGSLQMVLLLFSVLLASVALIIHYGMLKSDLSAQKTKISRLQADRTRLQQIKAEVDQRQRQEATLKQRVAVIEQLQRNRTGGQELLEQVANTVNRVDALWMTSLTRKGNELTMEGSADSIAAVANLITQLKRSGYFGKVEIKESRQDERRTNVTIFLFTLTADFTLPSDKPGTASPGKS
jgi:Tfp pilus assembly protein PilN